MYLQAAHGEGVDVRRACAGECRLAKFFWVVLLRSHPAACAWRAAGRGHACGAGVGVSREPEVGDLDATFLINEDVCLQ